MSRRRKLLLIGIPALLILVGWWMSSSSTSGMKVELSLVEWPNQTFSQSYVQIMVSNAGTMTLLFNAQEQGRRYQPDELVRRGAPNDFHVPASSWPMTPLKPGGQQSIWCPVPTKGGPWSTELLFLRHGRKEEFVERTIPKLPRSLQKVLRWLIPKPAEMWVPFGPLTNRPPDVP